MSIFIITGVAKWLSPTILTTVMSLEMVAGLRQEAKSSIQIPDAELWENGAGIPTSGAYNPGPRPGYLLAPETMFMGEATAKSIATTNQEPGSKTPREAGNLRSGVQGFKVRAGHSIRIGLQEM